MDNALETLPAKEQTCRERLEEVKKQLKTAKEEVGRPFAKEGELKEKSARLAQLNIALSVEASEDQKNHMETEVGQEL